MAQTPRYRRADLPSAAAISRLRKGIISKVYLLHGSESFLRDEFLCKIRDAVLETESTDFNHDTFDWDRSHPADIVSAVQTLPFMASRRLVEVHGIGSMREADSNLLMPLLDNPAPSSVVVFIAEKVDFRRVFFKKIKRIGESIRMEPPAEKKLPCWVQSQAKKLGFDIAPEAAVLLVDMVDPSLGRLRSELEKLSLYLGPKEVAGVDTVREMVGRSRADAMYKLGDSLAEGDTPRALALLRGLAETEINLEFLIGFLRNQIRRWIIIKTSSAQGMGANELAGLLGIPSFAVDRLRRHVNRASARFLRTLYQKLLAVDRQIKRSGRQATGLHSLEFFIMDMCTDTGGFRMQKNSHP